MTRWKLTAALAGVAAIVLASVVVLLIAGGRQEPAAPPPSTPPPTRIQPPPAPTATATVAEGGEDRPMPGDQTNQVEVANAYIDAFLKPGTPEEREARLRDWATPADLRLAREVANDRLPRATRVGAATLDPAGARANQAYAHVRLSDGSWWGIGLVKDLTAPKQWRVSYLEREGH